MRTYWIEKNGKVKILELAPLFNNDYLVGFWLKPREGKENFIIDAIFHFKEDAIEFAKNNINENYEIIDMLNKKFI